MGWKRFLTARLTSGIKRHHEILATMEPKTAYCTVVRRKFCEEPPFDDVLPGLARRNMSRIEQNESRLPTFTFPPFQPTGDEAEPAVALRRSLHTFSRLLAIVEWWAKHRDSFRHAWSETIGQKTKDGTYPINCVQGDLLILEGRTVQG